MCNSQLHGLCNVVTQQAIVVSYYALLCFGGIFTTCELHYWAGGVGTLHVHKADQMDGLCWT